MQKIFLFLLVFCCYGSTWSQASISAVGAPFQNGQPLVFSYSGGTGAATDWIGIYQPNEIPDGDPGSIVWKYIPTPAGQVTFTFALPNGDYKAHLFCCDGYTILASVAFSVQGAAPAVVDIPHYFKVDSLLTFNYSGGTGSPTDWIGIYKPNQKPGTDLSLAYEYIPTDSGSITFDTITPALPAGKYVAKLFCCDGYDVLDSINFTIFENLAPSVAPVGTLSIDKPAKFKFTGGTGSFTDWVGIYTKDEVPDGDPSSVTYLYVDGVNGEVEFSPINLQAGVAYDAHLFCCDVYTILASYKNFTISTVGTDEALQQPALFDVTPSPAREVVNLVFAQPLNGQFTFYQTTGQAVRSLAINGVQRLEVRDLPPGMYIGQFQGKEGTQAKKIIIER